MGQSTAQLGGSGGSHYVLVLESHEVSVDTPNNRSLIEVTVYLLYNGGYNSYNNFGSGANAPSWGASGSGFGSAGGNFTYNATSGGQTWTFIGGNQYWIGHDSNGNASVSFSASVNANNSPYVTSASTSLSYGLTHINRQVNFTGFGASNVTDEGFTLSASVDQGASVINFSIDGGGSYSGGGSGTGASQDFHNQPSQHSFTCYAHAVSAASGLDSYSGPITVTTLGQSNFMGIDPMV